MDRKDFFKKQRVTQQEVDAAFAYVEQGLWNPRLDDNIVGVITGLVPSLGSAPNVNITKGVAIDQLGKRVKAYSDGSSTKSISYATDTLGVATSVTGGQERWISLYANFGKQALDPRVDGDGVTVYFDQPEVLHDGTVGLGGAGVGTPGVDKFLIVSGASAPTGTATRPALLTTAILVCDILRTPSDAANVLSTTRRVVYGISDAAAPGTGNGMALIMSAMSAWAGGRTNPAQVSLHATIDKIITDLAATAASDDGAERIGAQASGTLPGGSVRSQLDALDSLKAALAAASNHFTGNQIVDGSGSFGVLLTALAGLTVTGTTTITGNQTVSGSGSFGDKVRITPTTATAALDTPSVAATTGRVCLLDVPFANGAGGGQLKIYLNNKPMFTNGPISSILLATNASWNGTTWDVVTPSSYSHIVEIGGTRVADGSTQAATLPGLVIYRGRSGGATMVDADFAHKVDLGYIADPAGVDIPNNLIGGVGGTANWNMTTGHVLVAPVGMHRKFRLESGGYGGAAYAAKIYRAYGVNYTSAPSSVTITTTANTNCGAPTVLTNAVDGVTVSSATTGGGDYFFNISIDVLL